MLAAVHATLHDGDEVFSFLNKAYEHRSAWLPSLPVEPKFAAYRKDPRYKDLLARLKVPEAVDR